MRLAPVFSEPGSSSVPVRFSLCCWCGCNVTLVLKPLPSLSLRASGVAVGGLILAVGVLVAAQMIVKANRAPERRHDDGASSSDN